MAAIKNFWSDTVQDIISGWTKVHVDILIVISELAAIFIYKHCPRHGKFLLLNFWLPELPQSEEIKFCITPHTNHTRTLNGGNYRFVPGLVFLILSTVSGFNWEGQWDRLEISEVILQATDVDAYQCEHCMNRYPFRPSCCDVPQVSRIEASGRIARTEVSNPFDTDQLLFLSLTVSMTFKFFKNYRRLGSGQI